MNTKSASEPKTRKPYVEWLSASQQSKPYDEWLSTTLLPEYQSRAAEDLPKWFGGVAKQRRELLEELEKWKESSNAWMNSALVMGQALLSIGEALGVDVSDNELLREADACVGVPDHE